MSAEWLSYYTILLAWSKKHFLLNKSNILSSCLSLPVNMVSVLLLRQIRLKTSLLPLPSIRQQPTNNKSQILAFSGSCSPLCLPPLLPPTPTLLEDKSLQLGERKEVEKKNTEKKGIKRWKIQLLWKISVGELSWSKCLALDLGKQGQSILTQLKSKQNTVKAR